MPKYARLLAVLESSAKIVEDRGETARSEVADLQRLAIASLQECADIALRLAERLGDEACPRDITCLHLGDWTRCDACFDEQVGRFFDQASKFITAVAASDDGDYQEFRVRAGRTSSQAAIAFEKRSANMTAI